MCNPDLSFLFNVSNTAVTTVERPGIRSPNHRPSNSSHRVDNRAFTIYQVSQGWFPLTRNFSVRTLVNFTRVHKIEAMYERLRVNVRVERGSTFTFMRGLSYIASIFFTRKITWQCKSTFSLKKCWKWITQLWMAMYKRDMLTEKLQNCNGFFTTHLYALF